MQQHFKNMGRNLQKKRVRQRRKMPLNNLLNPIQYFVCTKFYFVEM